MMCFFKQKAAYGVRISDWSSDVCSSDLLEQARRHAAAEQRREGREDVVVIVEVADAIEAEQQMDLLEVALLAAIAAPVDRGIGCAVAGEAAVCDGPGHARAEVLVPELSRGGHHHPLRAAAATQGAPTSAP